MKRTLSLRHSEIDCPHNPLFSSCTSSCIKLPWRSKSLCMLAELHTLSTLSGLIISSFMLCLLPRLVCRVGCGVQVNMLNVIHKLYSTCKSIFVDDFTPTFLFLWQLYPWSKKEDDSASDQSCSLSAMPPFALKVSFNRSQRPLWVLWMIYELQFIGLSGSCMESSFEMRQHDDRTLKSTHTLCSRS